MSGSKGCKYHARTRHDTTNGRVSDVIELAVVLTNHPDAPEARAALARVSEELVKTRSDAIIARAIKGAPSCAVAQTLQHAVEAASERVVIYRDRGRAELQLFAVPIITTFEQNVPESQFESALSGFNGQHLASSMKDGMLERADTVLVPKLLRLNDLDGMPLSLVRKRGIDLGTGAVSGRHEWHQSRACGGSFKRSTAFLRFLVGQRQLFDHEESDANEHALCAHLQVVTSRALRSYLRLPCRVQVYYVPSFYEGLYSGMWLYQETRLDQLARATCAQTRRNKRLEARVVTYGGRHRFEMWLGFFAGNQAVGGHAYRLASRPSEDLAGCVSRITNRLEAAGIKARALTAVVPEERRFNLRIGRTMEPSMITIPI